MEALRQKYTSPCMEKLNRLGWTAGMAFRAYGLRIGVRSNDPAVLDQLELHLPRERTAAPIGVVDRLYSIFLPPPAPTGARTKRYALAYGDSALVGRSLDREEALEGFGADLQLFIAMMARRRIFVHAGVVGWHGQAILVPGKSMAGKSTLVAALVEAGATYYSDEYAVLDDRGRVHPYHSPLSLRNPEDQKRTRILPEALGAGPGLKPLRVGLVAHIRYEKNKKFSLRRLSSGRAVLTLFRNTVPARLRPKDSLAALKNALETAVAVNGVRGEAHYMVASLLSLLDKEPATHALSAKA